MIIIASRVQNDEQKRFGFGIFNTFNVYVIGVGVCTRVYNRMCRISYIIYIIIITIHNVCIVSLNLKSGRLVLCSGDVFVAFAVYCMSLSL